MEEWVGSKVDHVEFVGAMGGKVGQVDTRGRRVLKRVLHPD